MQSENVAQTYKLYLKAKTILAEGGFKCIVNAAFLAHEPPGVEVKKDRGEPTHCVCRLSLCFHFHGSASNIIQFYYQVNMFTNNSN